MSANENANDNAVAISYYIEEFEKTDNEPDFDVEEFMNQIEEEEFHDDMTVPHMINYHENYTVKELVLICDYYGFAKDVKANKFNKEQIIDFLVSFESNIANTDIVFRRQNMWFYINELKNDKFMKKFILW
jgi:hypothetical protein